MMRSPNVLALGACALLFAALNVACSDDASPTEDAGDAGTIDATAPYDSGVVETPDSGPRPDARPRDSGFSDPDTIIEGQQLIGGLRTWVQVQGTLTSTLPPVLVFHDGPSLAHEYLPAHLRFLVSNAAGDPIRTVVYYDMRATGRSSFGASTETTTLTVDRHVLDVENVVEWVESKTSQAKVDVVAHGYGAAVAALFAAAHPERVDRMVLVTPFPVTATQLANFNAESRSRLTTGERTLINQLTMQPSCFGDINMCTMEIWAMLGPHYMCDENRSLFSEMTFTYGDYRTTDFIELDLRNQRYDWRPTFGAITASTTVISGPCDPTPAETASDYAAAIPGATHTVFSTSGHFPFVEARDQFRTLVRAALHR